MPLENIPEIPEIPEESKEVTDVVAKAGYLKVETELGDIKLNSHNSVEIQPEGTLFGAKVKVNNDNSVTPSLTFDTKKLHEPKKNIDIKKMVDDAIDDFWEQV